MSDYLELRKKALLMGANVFWLPTGISRDDVLAAYRFKGVASEAFALQDLAGYHRDLQSVPQGSKKPTWDSASGFTFEAVSGGACGYLDNNGLDKSDIKAAVVCYSGLTGESRGYLMTAGGASGKAFLFAATTAAEYTSVSGTEYSGVTVTDYVGPGYVTSAYSSYTWVGTMAYVGTVKTEGVVGANFGTTGGLYLDGIAATTTSTDEGKTFCDTGNGKTRGYTFGNSHTNNSTLINTTHAGKVIIAAAFFGVELTDAQHAEVAAAMLAL